MGPMRLGVYGEMAPFNQAGPEPIVGNGLLGGALEMALYMGQLGLVGG